MEEKCEDEKFVYGEWPGVVMDGISINLKGRKVSELVARKEYDGNHAPRKLKGQDKTHIDAWEKREVAQCQRAKCLG